MIRVISSPSICRSALRRQLAPVMKGTEMQVEQRKMRAHLDDGVLDLDALFRLDLHVYRFPRGACTVYEWHSEGRTESGVREGRRVSNLRNLATFGGGARGALPRLRSRRKTIFGTACTN
jgi:hypothetical protein